MQKAGGEGDTGEQREGGETFANPPPQLGEGSLSTKRPMSYSCCYSYQHLLGMKRPYSEEGGSGREELWSLHDVIFTDRVQSVRVGRVLKIDGLFAAVHFPVKGEVGKGEEGREEEGRGEPMEEGDGAEVLERCRLLRKDDLVVRNAWFSMCMCTLGMLTDGMLCYGGL